MKIGNDNTGREILEGDIVRHNDSQRPPGTFKVEWDCSKIGYVLIGQGSDSDGWLREWSPKNVSIISR